MLKIDTHKKPAPPDSPSDWSPNYIIYRLHERGTSLRRLSRQNKYSESAAAQTFHLPWPKMQQLIAEAIGVQPEVIWPTRYNADGTPKPGAAVRKLIAKVKHSTRTASVNVHSRKVA